MSALVGGALATVAAILRYGQEDSFARAGDTVAALVGAGLAAGALLIHKFPGVIGGLLRDAPGNAHIAVRPRLTLFIASFAALFLELALIRYAGSQLRVFAFFKNVPLVAAYLGLGVGCAKGGGGQRHATSLLLWAVPMFAALAAAPLIFSGLLGRAAAAATSEQILGDTVVRSVPLVTSLLGQLGVGAVCFITLIAIASLFVPLGQLLGGAFEQLPRLPAYMLNILGSIGGTLAFVLLSALWLPPWTWVAIGLLPLLWWLRQTRDRIAGAALVAASALAVAPSIGDTIWSPYQKLVGRPVIVQPDSAAPPIVGYRVDISDVFYQVAMDLRAETVARAGANPLPHYDAALTGLERPIGSVLIVGSGTGNDVAAALRAGARRVDAVDIDPAIIGLGRAHHPEHPYDDARVRVIVADARAAFRRFPPGTYDAVLFGLLDSHTQLGMSSVRLDNYVFTAESFAEARRLLRPGGRLVVTAAIFRAWFRQRFVDLLSDVCRSPVSTRDVASTTWVTYQCRPGDEPSRAINPVPASVPTDDWPFLYLPRRAIPFAYAFVVVLLAWGSVLVLGAHGLAIRRFTTAAAHMFCLGAAFLLMEVYAINRLALLFGTTWTVSAVAIVIVLTLIAAANITVALVPTLAYSVAYLGLAASLALSYRLDPGAALGRGADVAVAYGFAALLPVYFAGLVFARSFVAAPQAGSALGANMLGAVVGGWAEYSSMALGIRALLLLAALFYAGSFVFRRVRQPFAAGG